ncbi:MAG: PIN domain-containing protein [Defluviitaleaceae bacterium]|nr:PIN domain-containing protein [Defluviitaleaceae bacterium]MCL2262982.1 PIN domain-containing protein [Defluviitaleaceae bacterium]
MVYVLDTNVVLHYLREDASVVKHYVNAVSDGCALLIPRAVDYEVCRGIEMISATKKAATYNEMTKPSPSGQCKVVDMGETVWETAKRIYIELRKKHLTVGEIDILIGAFCLQYNYTLVTANTKDFQNMSGLKLVNWWDRQQEGKLK